MSPEDRLLLACIRPDADSQRGVIAQLGRDLKLRWDVVYSIADRDGVAPLVYANLRECNPEFLSIPEETIVHFENDLYYNIIAKEKLAEKVAQVLGFLNRERVEVMLVKGAALDILVYAQPWYTVLNDVDLIFRLRQAEMTTLAVPQFLDRFQDQGVHFEYDYFRHHDLTMNGTLPVDFEGIWEGASKINFRGREVWVMCPEDLLIAACINSCRKRFFQLKALRDLTEILNHFRGMHWEELSRKARAYHCNNIVYAALVVARITVGIELPEKVLAGLAVPTVRTAIIGYLSRRMSFASLASLYSGSQIFGRAVSWGLLLPYMTYRREQVWKRIEFVWGTRLRRQELPGICRR